MVVRGDTLLVGTSGAWLVLLGMLVTAACASASGQGNPAFDGGSGDASGRDGAGGTGGAGGAGGVSGGDAGGAAPDGSAGAAGMGGGAGEGGAAGSTGECATLGAWQASEPFADAEHVSHPLPSFAAGRYYYVHTKTRDGADDRILYSALQNADGSLGPWQVASADHGGGPHGYTAVVVDGVPYHFRNGHIARYDCTSDGKVTDIVLVEDSVDTAFGGDRFVWDSAVFAVFGSGDKRVFHLGGFSFTPYAYRNDVRRNAAPVQPRFEDTGAHHPAERPGKAALFAPPGSDFAFLFTGRSGGSELWRARVHADGTLDAFESLPELPVGTGNARGDMFVVDRTLFVVRGSAVYRATLSGDGGLSGWESQPSLPEEQVDISWGDGHLEGASHGILGSFVYLTGPKRVYYAPILAGQPCT